MVGASAPKRSVFFCVKNLFQRGNDVRFFAGVLHKLSARQVRFNDGVASASALGGDVRSAAEFCVAPLGRPDVLRLPEGLQQRFIVRRL